MKRLLKFLFKHHKWSLLLVIVLILVSTLCTLAMTLFTKTLIDDYILPLTQAAVPDFSPLAVALVKLASVLLVGTAASFLYSYVMILVGQGTMKTMRTDLFDHLQSLPLRYFDSHPHGDIMSVFTNDIDTLRQMVGRSVPQLFSSVITIISTLTSMIVLSFPLTIISVATTIVALVLSVKLAKTSRMYFKARQMNLAKVNGYIEEMVSGQKVVKVFCHEDEVMSEFKVLSENLRKSVNDANRVANIIMPINGNIANIGFVLIAIVGAAITIKFPESSLTIGTVVSFLTLHRNFSRPVSQISQEANSIAMASAGAERVYAMADEKGETDSGKVVLDNVSVSDDGSMQKSESRTGSWAWQKDDDSLVRLEGKVSLSDVDFGYVPEKQVLYDISLTAYPGQKIAFVGGTGAGKTTITNLINRFYDIQDGAITYDDIDVKDIRKDSLRSSLGIVLQETHLFTGTILDNIRYGRLDATDKECVEAAKMVYADSFIRRLPNGYNTVIDGEGESLSQGERQLLSIARTAVANPPVLILDEATSSIDTRTERLIQKAMDKIMKGRTTFVIAHRLSTVQNADYIIVLEKGRIIEAGKHFELLERKGKYFELFTGGSVVS